VRCTICEFVSWIEKKVGKKKEVLFLTSDDIFNSKRGKQLQKAMGSTDGISLNGHGSTRWFYGKLNENGEEIPLEAGRDMECTNFSSPDNFPKEIVKAIKSGRMTKMGCPGRAYMRYMLKPSAVASLREQSGENIEACGNIKDLPVKTRDEVLKKISRIVSNQEADCGWTEDNNTDCDEVRPSISFFDWDLTKEGQSYWENINKMLVGYESYIDKDEEVDREKFWKLFAVKKNRQPAWR
jgi:hypothetical protein